MITERIKISIGIGMDDSEIVSSVHSVENNKLVVQIRAWDESMIKISFLDAIMFICKGGNLLGSFCQLISHSRILQEALALEYEEIPKDHPYKVYQLINIEDTVALEVVCENYEVVVEERKM